MKKTLLTLLSICLFTQLHAQQFEYSVFANGGLFHYSGNNTVSTSFINGGAAGTKQGYTNEPYGNKNGFSYGAGMQVQHVGKAGFIVGLQAGFDVLRSNEDINMVYTNNPEEFTPAIFANPAITAKGHTILQSQDINLNPYIGYRLNMRKVKIDIMPGFDLAFNVNTHENGKATATDGQVYQTDLDRGTSMADVRLKLGVAAWYKKWGLTAGYAHGLVNFSSHLLNDSPTAYYTRSNLIQFGLSYRLVN